MKMMKYFGMFILMGMMSAVMFAKTLYVGTNAEFAPFEYLEKENNRF